MKKIVVTALLASGILFFANCHPKMHKASSGDKTAKETKEAPAAAPAATPEQIAQGKTIYDGNCGKCHDLPKPEDYTEKRWDKILPDMCQKATLSAGNSTLVKAYVYANLKKTNPW